ncbi:hypothetical protein [Streptomyces meridianus]|uniref:Uncharacterized protein n=1 Tax=Streptomyces meridianus TaxID=2938945 RepID=A0ABT0X5Q2_9ACTN|nr:hypothetical protein [Streptomyces meridianus]MCM2577856.1 hypothetical protein [Streptomyces meridianus]
MSAPDRKEQEVRRMLDGPHPVVPPDLARLAVERGRRLLTRRRALRVAAGVLIVVAVAAFTLWAVTAQPWLAPPAGTTPPLDGW